MDPDQFYKWRLKTNRDWSYAEYLQWAKSSRNRSGTPSFFLVSILAAAILAAAISLHNQCLPL
jgi:hypothetical protein